MNGEVKRNISLLAGSRAFFTRLPAPPSYRDRALQLLSNPIRFMVQPGTTGVGSWGDAQAACDFRGSSSSYFLPFFQTAKVMAASLRARVRRTISGRRPWFTLAVNQSCQGPGRVLASTAMLLNRRFSSQL